MREREEKWQSEGEEKWEDLENDVIVGVMRSTVAFLGNLCIHIIVNLVSFHIFSKSLGISWIIGWFLVTTLWPEGKFLLYLFGGLVSDFWQRYLVR